MNVQYILKTIDETLLTTNVAVISIEDAETNMHEGRSYTVFQLINELVEAKEKIISLESSLEKKQETINKQLQHFIDNMPM